MNKKPVLYTLIIIFFVVISGILAYISQGGNDYLGLVSNIFQVVTVGIAIAAWICAMDYLSDRRKHVQKVQNNPNSAIYMISLADKDIRGQVETYVKNKRIVNKNTNIAYLPLQDSIPSGFSIEVSERFVNINCPRMPETEKTAARYLKDYMETLGVANNYIRKNGYKEVHLFMLCPVVLSYYVGKEMNNNFTVIPYHFTKDDSVEIYIPV